MEPVYELFLQAVRAAVTDQAVEWAADISQEELLGVFELAQAHHVLPLVYEAVHTHPAVLAQDPTMVALFKKITVQSVMGQTIKTLDFLELEQHLRKKGVRVLVVKGIICRELYPKPDHRSSGDEDVLCGEEPFPECHEAMLDFGMEAGDDPDLASYEIPYRKADSPLYIELHKTLFARNSDVFNDYNRFFEDVFQRAVEVPIRGVPVATLHPTDHMLYLIIHAYKHFLHSGFGIRQVCDMILFAQTYGYDIDWSYVYDTCKSIRADKFALALFRIGEKYLDFSPEKAHQPALWSRFQINEGPLLEDMLCGGIYGSSERSRVHSSNMTLNAVAAGKKNRTNVLRTVFPSAKSLEGKYRYLRRHKYLLPVAWTCRIFSFARESISDSDSAAGEVLRTGSRRIELLKEYDIIDR